MENELQSLVEQFLKILHLYSVISRKPKDYGTGDKLYLAEIHTITMVGKNTEINMTRLAEIMGVTKGAISQTIRKLLSKGYIIKKNLVNRKEYSLQLSDKGMKVFNEHQSFLQELFNFAAALYDNATPADRELVKRLFAAIAGNMEARIKSI